MTAQHLAGHTHFAIIDNRRDCIGTAGFEHCQDGDLFYFWLGAPYRCQGIGSKMARHIQASASEQTKTIYALTFENNQACKHAFHKSNWYPVNLPVSMYDKPITTFAHRYISKHQARRELRSCFLELQSELMLC